MKSNDFMEFVKEKILHLLDLGKTDDAMIRCKNILDLLKKKSANYWLTQFKLILVIC